MKAPRLLRPRLAPRHHDTLGIDPFTQIRLNTWTILDMNASTPSPPSINDAADAAQTTPHNKPPVGVEGELGGADAAGDLAHHVDEGAAAGPVLAADVPEARDDERHLKANAMR